MMQESFLPHWWFIQTVLVLSLVHTITFHGSDTESGKGVGFMAGVVPASKSADRKRQGLYLFFERAQNLDGG